MIIKKAKSKVKTSVKSLDGNNKRQNITAAIIVTAFFVIVYFFTKH